MNPIKYPAFLQQLIDNPPAAGSGIHDWLFSVSRNLHAHLPVSQIEDLLRTKLVGCGRTVPEREIKAAIKCAVDFAWKPKGSANSDRPALNAPPKPDLVKIERLVRGGKRLADLWHESPFWFESPMTENIIDQLFPGNPLLCCGLASYEFDTKSREEWRGQLARQQFIVPSPMSARIGKTQEGKDSAHAIDNTGPRKFLVIEFDYSEFARDGKTETIYAPLIRSLAKEGITVQDMCAACLFFLMALVPMTLAVASGGKSIHGWWYCGDQADENILPFWRNALKVGADPKTWTKSQFIRMPNGTRANGKEQTVFYFNPSTLPVYEPAI